MARKPSPPRRVAKSAPTDLVGDLNRQVRRARDASDRSLPATATQLREVSTLGPTDERATPSRQAALSHPAGRTAHDAEPDPGSLVIVRTYNPASDLEQRLSRIYAMLSLPATDPPGDHDIE